MTDYFKYECKRCGCKFGEMIDPSSLIECPSCGSHRDIKRLPEQGDIVLSYIKKARKNRACGKGLRRASKRLIHRDKDYRKPAPRSALL